MGEPTLQDLLAAKGRVRTGDAPTPGSFTRDARELLLELLRDNDHFDPWPDEDDDG